jgi:hypothetical protein
VLLRSSEAFRAPAFFSTPGTLKRKRYPWAPLSRVFAKLDNIDGQAMTLDNRFPNVEPERFKILATEPAASRPDIVITVARTGGDCHQASDDNHSNLLPFCIRPGREGTCSQSGASGRKFHRLLRDVGRINT